METTILLAKVVGPLLILRGVSILIDRRHFLEMLDNVEAETKTVSFSLVPVALFMTGMAVGLTYRDTSSLAAILFQLIAWGMVAKSTLLILFPRLVAKKARLLGQAGFLNVVCLVTITVGACLTWFGYSAWWATASS
ncbi:MAG: hypothetical protein DWQ37_01175 [Planctomycetota bacterium]|nr:MAG: hypothetical protein DWQ37_01175 [Planctomycetota bacterium]